MIKKYQEKNAFNNKILHDLKIINFLLKFSYKWMFDCHNVGYFLDMDFTSRVCNMELVMSVKLNETV